MSHGTTRIPVSNVSCLRYVLFSERRGVYLSDGVWSKDPGAGSRPNAETFMQDQEEVAGVTKNVPDASPYQCFPDLPDNRASKDAVANCGLPRW